MRHRIPLAGSGVALAVVIATMPLWANQAPLFLAGLALTAAFFALSWNLLFGVTGLATFGHAAFLFLSTAAVALALWWLTETSFGRSSVRSGKMASAPRFSA